MSFFKQPHDILILRASVRLTEVANGEHENDFRILHEMAALSANVYEESDEFDTTWEAVGKRIPIDGWEKLCLSTHELIQPKWKYKVEGLKYELWKKQINESKTVVALVFRGTDSLWDWYTNFRWLTRFVPFTWDHYDQVESILDKIVSEIHEKVGVQNVKIMSTGHSLGGGLAQLAAYSSPHIKKVFAFDPSPVTGFYGIKKKEREQNKVGLIIYRIYEHGELLAYVRLMMKLIFPISHANPQIMEARFNFVGKNPVSQHNMKKLVEKMTNAIKKVDG